MYRITISTWKDRDIDDCFMVKALSMEDAVAIVSKMMKVTPDMENKGIIKENGKVKYDIPLMEENFNFIVSKASKKDIKMPHRVIWLG